MTDMTGTDLPLIMFLVGVPAILVLYAIPAIHYYERFQVRNHEVFRFRMDFAKQLIRECEENPDLTEEQLKARYASIPSYEQMLYSYPYRPVTDSIHLPRRTFSITALLFAGKLRIETED